jgi:hypothetical protein
MSVTSYEMMNLRATGWTHLGIDSNGVERLAMVSGDAVQLAHIKTGWLGPDHPGAVALWMDAIVKCRSFNTDAAVVE